MTRHKTAPSPGQRGEQLRQQVIDAAERLLRASRVDFAMRDLAAEAGVSFATPFNQFGSKAAIMHALSARRVDTMERRFLEQPPLAEAADRVRLAVDTAVAVMLEEPEVNRAVMGWIGTATSAPGQALARSTSLWTLALGRGDGLAPASRPQALRCLPEQLAFVFRGILSFWTAGELPDEALGTRAREGAATLVLAYAAPRSARADLTTRPGRPA